MTYKPGKNISEDLADLLRQMIFSGKLAPGERLKEIELSERLSVSRTPLREALATLVAEGALISMPRRGVVVRELSVEEAKQIYPIRSLLDPEALRLSGIPSNNQLASLERKSARLRNAKTVESAIKLDDEWHMLLYSGCPNEELLKLIGAYMRKTRRYELASMRGTTLSMSSDSKNEVTAHLRDGDLSAACARLRKSLEGGLIPILKWFEQIESGK